MVLYGVGEIIGGQLVGSIKDGIGVKVATVFELCLMAAGSSIILVFNNQNEYGVLAYLMCLVWGL